MTVTRGQKSTLGQTGSGSGVVTSWGTNPAAGSSVLVFVQCVVQPTSVIDNGTSPTTFTADVTNTNLDGAYIYRANSITLPSSGAYHATVAGASGHTYQAYGIEYIGMKSGAPDATVSPHATGTAVSSGSITPLAAGGVIFGGFTDDTGLNPETITFTGSAPETEQARNTNGSSFSAMAVADALTGSAQTFTWTLGDSQPWACAFAAYSPAGGTTHSGTAGLSGSGTLTGAGVFTGTATLDGNGTLSATGTHGTSHGHGVAALDGNGTLNGLPVGTFVQFAVLSGVGTLSATWTGTLVQPPAGLNGQGTLQLSGVKLGFTAALSGNGTLSVLQATGGRVFASSGVSVPYAYPLLSQVMVAPPSWQFTLSGGTTTYFVVSTVQSENVNPGDVFTNSTLSGTFTVTSLSAPFAGFVNVSYTPTSASTMDAGDVVSETSARWTPLGSIGVMTALTYSYTCPGGASQMTATIMVPATYRTQFFNPGWQVRITRGGHQVWSGKLDEPQPTAAGWTLTASGAGNRGQDYLAIYTSKWPNGEPDEAINNAIARGMPWVNPGVGTPSGAWFGQAVDPGAQTVSGLLDLICTRGGLTWMVSSQPGGTPGDDLSVFPLPTAPNRLLVSVDPVPRTLGGDINTIYLRYQVTSDDTSGSGAAAVFATTTVQNAASVAAHEVIETYIDLSDVGTMTAAAAQAVGTIVLSIYQRASFAGSFTARYGQLLNLGGVPIDPGTDQAGTMVKLILTDFGFGGEVTPNLPVTFITGAYEWDDLAQVATISAYQNVDQSLTGLLSLVNTLLTPIAVASS